MKMNLSKFLLSTLFFGLLVFATSCDTTTDPCVPPALQQNIVGTWKADYEPTATAFEFKTDGTLTDPDDAVLGGEINGDKLTVKTYRTIGEDSLYVRAASPTTTNAIDATFPVVSNECDKITIEIFTVQGSFTRQ
jgi:hypothetical protein